MDFLVSTNKASDMCAQVVHKLKASFWVFLGLNFRSYLRTNFLELNYSGLRKLFYKEDIESKPG